MEWMLGVSLAMVVHAYLGYPATLMVLGLFFRRDVTKEPITPTVSLIIAASNEEGRIRAKLENALKLEYPCEKLHVVVVSDGSTDGTNDVVREFASRGVTLIECPQRRGKENAQKEALQKSSGDVVVFSDVATLMDPGALREIVANFADRSVGCVSSVDRVIGQDGAPCGEGLYVRYEMWLRDLEGQVCSLVGLSGSFFAARREVCTGFSGEVQSDFRTLLASVALGLRGVSDPAAIGYYRDLADTRREFDRKVRTVLRGLTVFFRNLRYLNPFRYGLFSYLYLCHKLLRWLVPLFLVVAFATNLMLSGGSLWYLLLLAGQVLFYALAFVGRYEKWCTPRTLKIPSYFVTVNLAIALAWWKYVSGQRVVMWSPSQR